LIELADQRMYKAKHAGRNRCYLNDTEVIQGKTPTQEV